MTTKEQREAARNRSTNRIVELATRFYEEVHPTAVLLSTEDQCCCGGPGARLITTYAKVQNKIGFFVDEKEFTRVTTGITRYLDAQHSTGCYLLSCLCSLPILCIPMCILVADDNKVDTQLQEFLKSCNRTVDTTSSVSWEKAHKKISGIICRVPGRSANQTTIAQTCDAEITKLLRTLDGVDDDTPASALDNQYRASTIAFDRLKQQCAEENAVLNNMTTSTQEMAQSPTLQATNNSIELQSTQSSIQA
eukprot:TRINITY_DN766_c0_g1_i1.p1 TRINITY_DN766_c0_g1~~TRINITY_DN766_c0_g1_i1.p1  ORF type:complete len:250 (+),score=48.17 TRINITY_DN766_c0_g1_i1:19-768(+)